MYLSLSSNFLRCKKASESTLPALKFLPEYVESKKLTIFSLIFVFGISRLKAVSNSSVVKYFPERVDKVVCSIV